ncbi:MAG: hypothetical protein MZU95_04330 [Desulfomicrobium escambiense]|nr:hypothetical protein [Desulfomicrobium escambiense]
MINSINLKIEPVICSERSILEAIEKHYLNPEIKTNFEAVNAQESVFDWQNELSSQLNHNMQAINIVQAILNQAAIEQVQEIILENQRKRIARNL